MKKQLSPDISKKISIFVYLILALLFRSYLITFQNNIDPDGVWYATLGKNLFAGKGYINQLGEVDLQYPPLYPILIGLFSIALKDAELAARIISLISGTLLILPIFFLAKRFYGEKTAHAAAILIIFYPVLSKFSVLVFTEATYTFLFFCALLSGWYCLRTDNMKYPVLTAILYGLCTLTRPEGAMFFLIFLAVFFFFKYKRFFSKAVLSGAFLMGLVFLMTILPYVVFIHGESGEWSLGKKSAIVFYMANFIENNQYGYEKSIFALTENGKDLKLYSAENKASFLGYFSSNPQKVLGFYISNVYLTYRKYLPELIPLVLLLPLGLGLFQKEWDRKRMKKELYLFIFLLPPLFLYPFFLTHSRRFVPFIPIGILWSARGIVTLQDWAAESIHNLHFQKYRPGIEGLVRKAIIAIIVLLVGWQATAERDRDDVRYKKIGFWLKNVAPEQTVIMARQPYISFYADKRFVNFPYDEDYKKVFRYARHHKVNYLVVDYNLLGFRNHLDYLTDWYQGKNLPPELKLVFMAPGAPGRRILIYAFSP